MRQSRHNNRRTSRASSSRTRTRVARPTTRSSPTKSLTSFTNASNRSMVTRAVSPVVRTLRVKSLAPVHIVLNEENRQVTRPITATRRNFSTDVPMTVTRRQFSTDLPFHAPKQLFQNLNPTVAKHLVDTQHERDITELQDVFQMEILSRLTSPNNWSPTMVTSRNLDEAKAHTRAFYRTVLRMTPSLLRQYDISELPPLEVAKVIRSHFERYPNVKDPAVMDTLRWNAQVDFTDIVRMYFTQANVISALFIDTHPQMLPKLPKEALPASTDVNIVQMHERPTDFLAEFLDPQETQRKARTDLYSINQI